MAQLPRQRINQGSIKNDHRVSFLLKEGEELFQCPYEKSHFVLEKKLVLHLNKCRHNYLNANKGKEPGIVVCRHSYLHHVKVEELEEHEDNCPSNTEVQLEKLVTKSVYEKRLEVVGADQQEIEKLEKARKEAMENAHKASKKFLAKQLHKNKKDKDIEPLWEPEEPGPEPDFNQRFTTYDPRKHVKKNQHDLVLNPQGMTRSERVAYREKVNSGNFCEEDEELPEIQPRFIRPGRDYRVPVGYPGWEIEDGYRTSSAPSKRMGP